MAQVERVNIRVRASVALFSEGKLLVVEHTKNGNSYWVLPGGHIEDAEACGEAAIREMKEECNIDVALGPLMFVGDYFSKGKHRLDVAFWGILQDESQLEGISNRNDPDGPHGLITNIRWLSKADLEGAEFRPREMKRRILDNWDTQPGWDGYLGSYRP